MCVHVHMTTTTPIRVFARCTHSGGMKCGVPTTICVLMCEVAIDKPLPVPVDVPVCMSFAVPMPVPVPELFRDLLLWPECSSRIRTVPAHT